VIAQWDTGNHPHYLDLPVPKSLADLESVVEQELHNVGASPCLRFSRALLQVPQSLQFVDADRNEVVDSDAVFHRYARQSSTFFAFGNQSEPSVATNLRVAFRSKSGFSRRTARCYDLICANRESVRQRRVSHAWYVAFPPNARAFATACFVVEGRLGTPATLGFILCELLDNSLAACAQNAAGELRRVRLLLCTDQPGKAERKTDRKPRVCSSHVSDAFLIRAFFQRCLWWSLTQAVA